MNATEVEKQTTPASHVDVLIVGAGISGVGSAYHLQQQCPNKSYAILEMKDTFGGTWETHKYPGVRSDSDLYTFGYRFKPWVGAPIASAEEILNYMGEVIEENGIGEHIHYGHRITGCSWSSQVNLWTSRRLARKTGLASRSPVTSSGCVRVTTITKTPTSPTGRAWTTTRGSLFMPSCGIPKSTFSGKRVLVIGSGATAATVIPAFAEKGRARDHAAAFAHLLLLQ